MCQDIGMNQFGNPNLVAQFQRLCEQSRLTIVGMDRISEGHLYFADGHFQTHPEYPGPHYKTMWGWGRDEKMEIAQPLYFAGGIGSSRQEERINAARMAAIDFVRSKPDA